MQKSQLAVNTASLAGLSLDEALAAAARTGFRGVELLAFDGMEHRAGKLAGFWFSRLSTARKDRIRRALAPFERRAVHLPFPDEPLLSYNPRVAELSRKLMEEGIRGAAFFGARTAVIHLAPPTNTWGKPLRGAHRKRALDVMRHLADYAARRRVRLGLETMYPRSIDEFAGFIADVAHPALGATLDVGHVWQAAELDDVRSSRSDRRRALRLHACECELIRLLGPRLFHVHLHGLEPGTFRDHAMPDTGILDFAGIFAALDAAGYTGLLSLELEVRPVKTAVRKAKRYFDALLEPSVDHTPGGGTG